MHFCLWNCLDKGLDEPLQRLIVGNVSSEMDVISSEHCLPLLKGFEWERWFLLQQKSSAAGSHSQLWNNDMRSDLSRALAQYSMYPLIFLAVLLHDRQSCYCGTPASVLSIKHVDQNESGAF